LPYPQQWAIRRLFDALATECPLVEPEHSADRTRSAMHAHVAAEAARQILEDTGLTAAGREYVGWLGLQLPSVRDAVWLMRALVVCNVLARREETVLFVPVNTLTDPAAMRMRSVLRRVIAARDQGFAAPSPDECQA